tara:strand:- start:197 stop:514 length:318 start_codon:yes stop_codon:yes gene_type:complete
MTFKLLKKLCTPAYVYLVISVVSILVLMFQNGGNTNTYCVGSFECPVANTSLIFLGEIIYVIFWTFILNLICKSGYKNISWFLVILPFVLFFVLLGLMILKQGVI